MSGGGTESPGIKVLDWGVFGGKEEKAKRKMTGLDGAVVTTCPEIQGGTARGLKYECPWKGRQGTLLKGFL